MDPKHRHRREIHARQASRRRAMQALYGWQLTGDEPKNILHSFREDEDHKTCDDGYFRELLLGITADTKAVDAHLSPCLDRLPSELDPTERALLWVAAWEMVGHPEIPYRVVINEAVALAKKYGADQSYRFVNAALDRLARNIRSLEYVHSQKAVFSPAP